MNHMYDWSRGWMGGGFNAEMGIWMLFGVLVVVLLVVLIIKVSEK